MIKKLTIDHGITLMLSYIITKLTGRFPEESFPHGVDAKEVRADYDEMIHNNIEQRFIPRYIVALLLYKNGINPLQVSRDNLTDLTASIVHETLVQLKKLFEFSKGKTGGDGDATLLAVVQQFEQLDSHECTKCGNCADLVLYCYAMISKKGTLADIFDLAKNMVDANKKTKEDLPKENTAESTSKKRTDRGSIFFPQVGHG